MICLKHLIDWHMMESEFLSKWKESTWSRTSPFVEKNAALAVSSFFFCSFFLVNVLFCSCCQRHILFRRGLGFPPWILCPTVTCVRQKMDTFSSIRSMVLSLSVFFFSIARFSHFTFFPFSLFSLFIPPFSISSFFPRLLSVLCPTPFCVRRQCLPRKAQKAPQKALGGCSSKALLSVIDEMGYSSFSLFLIKG